jgi:glycosyltransferase involved in cell wall biosynthesis
VTERPVVFLAWTSRAGRAEDVAAALGGHALVVFPRPPSFLKHPVSTAVRYVMSLVVSIGALVRLRPGVVIATNPPLFPPLLAVLWTRLTGGRFLMDSHPSAFGAKNRWVLGKLQPLHRWLGRRATGVLVTTEERAREVDAWGGRGLVVHEAPLDFPPPVRGGPTTVLFIGVFAPDEPVAELVEAARSLPDVRIRITGRLEDAAPGLVDGSPDNVEYVGYLGPDAFRDAVSSATVVLTLTTEPSSIMRSAYEADWARIPLVTTDTPALRETFPYADFCDNSPASIAEALRRTLTSYDEKLALADEAAAVQLARWEEQLKALRDACGL